jgi:hypothetical protein
MSRPVIFPTNSVGTQQNFGVVGNRQQAQDKYLDIPARTQVSRVAFAPTNAGTGIYLTSQYLQADTLYLNSSATGSVYYLPSSNDLLTAFTNMNLGNQLRFWITNLGTTGCTLQASPTGTDTTFNTVYVPQAVSDNNLAVAGGSNLHQVGVYFTSVNGVTGSITGIFASNSVSAQPYTPAYSTGTYRIYA